MTPVFYTEREVTELIGVSRSTLWRMVRQKEFPASVPISRGRVGFGKERVDGWIAAKLAAAEEAA
jgi:excisionase family DNA binding protein